MLGDVLLAGAERLGELVDGQGTLAERVEDPDAHGLADDAKALRNELDKLIGKGVRHWRSVDHEHNYTTVWL